MKKIFVNVILFMFIIFSGFFTFTSTVKAEGNKVESMCVYWIDGPIKKAISTNTSDMVDKAVTDFTNWVNNEDGEEISYASFMLFYDRQAAFEGKPVQALIITDKIIYSTLTDTTNYPNLIPTDPIDITLNLPSEEMFKNKDGFSTCPTVGWRVNWDDTTDPQFEYLTPSKKTFSDGVVKATLQTEFSRSGVALDGLSQKCLNLKGEALSACLSYYRQLQNPEKEETKDGEKLKCEDFTYNGVNIIDTLFSIIMIAGPILVIILGTVDLTKAVLSADEQAMKKAWKNASKRLIAAILLFIIPLILTIILKLAATAGILGEVAETCIK